MTSAFPSAADTRHPRPATERRVASMAGPMPLAAAADLQDHLMTACNDLDRLQDLLAHACDELMERFRGASDELAAHRRAADNDADCDDASAQILDRVQQHIGGAVTALQFQDMTSQLIAHTYRRLRSCADRIACDVFISDEDEGVVEQAPLRPNPVTQAEMDAGSIELF